MLDKQNKLKITDPALLYQPRGYAYIRLSRHDLRQPGTLEEKFAIRKLICQRVAEENGIALADEDIILEQSSGAKISTRPGIQRLLDLVRSKHAPHIITPYLDRLLRGDKRDEQEIEDALVLGEVTVCHTEGDPIRFDHDYDPLLFEVKSLVARQELRNYIKKRKETDRAKLELNQRFRGHAPYGYRYLRPTYDAYGNQLTAPGYETVEAEWPTVLEFWRRVETEPLTHIARAFNKDKAAHPPRNDVWNIEGLRSMARNPLYAGYQSQRARWVRGKQIVLRPEEFVLAKTPGAWEKAITLEQWWAVQESMASRYRAGRPRSGALSGLLYNWCGERMTICGGRTYVCHCRQRVLRVGASTSDCHPGYGISADKIERWCVSIVSLVLDATSANPELVKRMTVRRGREDSKHQLAARKTRLRQEVKEKRATVQDLMLRRSFFLSLFKEKDYNEAAERAAKELADAEAELMDTEQQLSAPDIAQIIPTLLRLQQRGLGAAWELLAVDDRHGLLRAFFQRIDLAHSGTARTTFKSATPTLWPWAQAALSASGKEIPPLPSVTYGKGG
jgi:DNA invertase Pin-like site-specific DNA recombinase